MTVFIMEYRKIGYTLADGVHPNPNHGKRRFTVDSKDIGTEDVNVLLVAANAPENTPDGYKLFSVRDRDAGVEVTP
jgi:hypothetical protein